MGITDSVPHLLGEKTFQLTGIILYYYIETFRE